MLEKNLVFDPIEDADYAYPAYPDSIESGKTVLGIHLGATYASVAVVRHDSMEMIPNSDGSDVTPNMVKFTDNEILIGEVLEVDSRHTIFDMTRLIGRKFNDRAVQDAIKDLPFRIINVDNRPKIRVELSTKVLEFSPEQITAMVLGKLKKQADEYLRASITDVVITVPVDFDEARRVS